MKLLLLGKNGQVGHEIEKLAHENGFNSISFSREELDITDYDQVKKVIKKQKPEVVINATAFHVVPECEAYPEKAFAINTLAVKNLADICEEVGAKFVHYSTDYIFDGRKGKPYKEYDLPNPLQVYGISKLAGEYAALQYCKRTLIIRGAYIYGGKTGSRSKKGNFVLTMLNQTDGKETLEVSSDQIVSPTYAADLAEATYKLLKKKTGEGIYHLVNEGSCSLAEFAQEIARLKKRKTKIIPIDRGGLSGNLRRPTYSALKNIRAKKLGIVLPSWKVGLKRYIATLD